MARAERIAEVMESWMDAFAFVKEDPIRNIKGLRSPQLGAVHAVHARWTVSDATATIVMPTGTGKTDTMISVLVSGGCAKVLVVVPTDVLRTQLVEKFLTLGVLKEPGCAVLAPGAHYPIVAALEHVPRSGAEVDEIFSAAQVVVTTNSIAGQCSEEAQERMAHHCPYLFIDEAHHAERRRLLGARAPRAAGRASAGRSWPVPGGSTRDGRCRRALERCCSRRAAAFPTPTGSSSRRLRPLSPPRLLASHCTLCHALVMTRAAAVGENRATSIACACPRYRSMKGPRLRRRRTHEWVLMKVPDQLRQQIDRWADAWIKRKFARGLELRAADPGPFNYPIEVFSQWRGAAFYICARYRARSRRPEDDFVVRSARMTLKGFDRFDLAYFRHTDRWFTVYRGLTAAECFEEIEGNEVFWPTM